MYILKIRRCSIIKNILVIIIINITDRNIPITNVPLYNSKQQIEKKIKSYLYCINEIFSMKFQKYTTYIYVLFPVYMYTQTFSKDKR